MAAGRATRLRRHRPRFAKGAPFRLKERYRPRSDLEQRAAEGEPTDALPTGELVADHRDPIRPRAAGRLRRFRPAAGPAADCDRDGAGAAERPRDAAADSAAIIHGDGAGTGDRDG